MRMWYSGFRFLWQYHPVLLFLLWEGMKCQEQTEALPGFKIEAPAEVTVQRGLCVLIPCNFTVGPGYNLTKDAIGIWYKGYNGYPNGPVAASTNSSQFPDKTNGRFIFTGKVSAGDCSFSISDAQPGDTDRYQFRLEGPLKFNYRHIQPNVSVTDRKETCLDSKVIPAIVAGNILILILMGLGNFWYLRRTKNMQEKKGMEIQNTGRLLCLIEYRGLINPRYLTVEVKSFNFEYRSQRIYRNSCVRTIEVKIVRCSVSSSYILISKPYKRLNVKLLKMMKICTDKGEGTGRRTAVGLGAPQCKSGPGETREGPKPKAEESTYETLTIQPLDMYSTVNGSTVSGTH
ncbi:hypothetical protein XELAEV_18036310mg [Xenopus laevis]|uniref:Immunoglobulin V-set domain-containing protein n=1 Tax=Xenopus laevis TaxID=8355 RepID=A0A974CH65_XENLA|nr:hypothetical protein XELAEV_18036310mg [Xenopus laevis]